MENDIQMPQTSRNHNTLKHNARERERKTQIHKEQKTMQAMPANGSQQCLLMLLLMLVSVVAVVVVVAVVAVVYVCVMLIIEFVKLKLMYRRIRKCLLRKYEQIMHVSCKAVATTARCNILCSFFYTHTHIRIHTLIQQGKQINLLHIYGEKFEICIVVAVKKQKSL